MGLFSATFVLRPFIFWSVNPPEKGKTTFDVRLVEEFAKSTYAAHLNFTKVRDWDVYSFESYFPYHTRVFWLPDKICSKKKHLKLFGN